MQLAAHVLGQLDRGHGEGLVRPLGLHLEGLGRHELVAEVGLGGLQQRVLVLGAGPGRLRPTTPKSFFMASHAPSMSESSLGSTYIVDCLEYTRNAPWGPGGAWRWR